ncbi:ATP-dependent nuclease [Pedobacter sp. WC2501]|uniref:ATP-dependent nuclease n=1 Tax=Pedobacter sp. WC2501 TaxID=3461400 RepID=UPI0040456AEC
MKFIEFNIKNFKGIEDLTFSLDKSPDANIFTLVGLNESGKTTILEALNMFNPNDESLDSLNSSENSKDENALIPISRRDNFNDTISIIVKLSLEDDDYEKINQFAVENTSFRKIKKVDKLTYYRHYSYENSQFVELDKKWSGLDGILEGDHSENYTHIGDKKYAKDNIILANFVRKLIPSILYYPNFLFDFPSKLYLEFSGKPTSKEAFYFDLVQDVLNSLDNDTEIETHILSRMRSDDKNDKRNLDRLIQKMERKISDIIFDAWNKIFKRKIQDTRIIIRYDVDGENLAFLELEIESEDGIYLINERSLGFRWFFIFLLFTQFRPYRKNSPKSVIYLFDEPASNLHPSAQTQLLKSFENLTKNSKVIYTTHSHHLINPNWLESTYVVKNEGFQLEKIEVFNIKKTNIIIESYREFATKHPHNTAYFQPILDVLDYCPSNLENIPKCIFLEGKNDFYTLAYFNEIVLTDERLNLAPSTGSGNLDTLISLYMGWNKEFIILLDSDKAGQKEKDRYIEKFGIYIEKRIFILSDINDEWCSKALESLFENNDAIKLQLDSYPESSSFNKTHFNRSIQENLINRSYFEFSSDTLDNFESILSFLRKKLDNIIE